MHHPCQLTAALTQVLKSIGALYLQGVHFEVCVHPSRALTEAKQQSLVLDT